ARRDVEFLLDQPGRPGQLYTNLYSQRSVYYKGSVPLQLDEGGSHLEVPGLAPGLYAIHARLKGRTRGWFRVLEFGVESASDGAAGAQQSANNQSVLNQSGRR